MAATHSTGTAISTARLHERLFRSNTNNTLPQELSVSQERVGVGGPKKLRADSGGIYNNNRKPLTSNSGVSLKSSEAIIPPSSTRVPPGGTPAGERTSTGSVLYITSDDYHHQNSNTTKTRQSKGGVITNYQHSKSPATIYTHHHNSIVSSSSSSTNGNNNNNNNNPSTFTFKNTNTNNKTLSQVSIDHIKPGPPAIPLTTTPTDTDTDIPITTITTTSNNTRATATPTTSSAATTSIPIAASVSPIRFKLSFASLLNLLPSISTTTAPPAEHKPVPFSTADDRRESIGPPPFINHRPPSSSLGIRISAHIPSSNSNSRPLSNTPSIELQPSTEHDHDYDQGSLEPLSIQLLAPQPPPPELSSSHQLEHNTLDLTQTFHQTQIQTHTPFKDETRPSIRKNNTITRKQSVKSSNFTATSASRHPTSRQSSRPVLLRLSTSTAPTRTTIPTPTTPTLSTTPTATTNFALRPRSSPALPQLISSANTSQRKPISESSLPPQAMKKPLQKIITSPQSSFRQSQPSLDTPTQAHQSISNYSTKLTSSSPNMTKHRQSAPSNNHNSYSPVGKHPSLASMITSSPPQEPPLLDTGSFGVGDRVRCANSMFGICRFIGTIQSKPGIWVGIDLGGCDDDPDLLLVDGEQSWRGKGKNSGSVNGTSYFNCDPNCGIFVPITKVCGYPFKKSPVALSFPQAESSSEVSSSAQRTPEPSSYPLAPEPSSNLKSPVIPRSSSPTKSSRPHRLTMTSSSVQSLMSSSSSASISTISTPKPLGRPSLPSQPASGSTSRKSISSITSVSHPTRSSGLTRKPSGRLTTESSSQKTGSPVPPLPSVGLRNQNSQPLLTNRKSDLKGSLSKSINLGTSSLLKRSSTSRIPNQNSGPVDRVGAHKRSGSVNSHHYLQDHSWHPSLHQASMSSIRSADSRPQSRLSVASQDQSICLKEENDYEETLRETEELKNKIRDLENEKTDIWARMKREKMARENLEAELQEMSKKEEDRQKQQESVSREDQAKMRIMEEDIKKMKGQRQKDVEDGQDFKKRLDEAENAKQDLTKQLERLRMAGQSLCTVYEEKIAVLENTRMSEINEANRQIEELRSQSAQRDVAKNQDEGSRASSVTRPANVIDQSVIAIEYEGLKSDLRYTNDRLSKLEEELYEAQSELSQERQKKEEIHLKMQKEEENTQISLKRLKEDNQRLRDEKEEIVERSRNMEVKLKELSETMEHERNELERLRDEISNGRSHEQMVGGNEDVKQLEVLLKQEREENEQNIKRIQSLEEQIRAPNTELIKKTDSSMSIDQQQIYGLKLIVQQSNDDRIRVESENKRLKKELEELKQLNWALEQNISSLINRINLDSREPIDMLRSAGLVNHTQKIQRLEKEIENLKQAHESGKKKHQKEIHDLNREVNELESMIESKIFREEELENEIERMRMGPKIETEDEEETEEAEEEAEEKRRQIEVVTKIKSTPKMAEKVMLVVKDCERCELCEGDHSIQSCPIFSYNTFSSLEIKTSL